MAKLSDPIRTERSLDEEERLLWFYLENLIQENEVRTGIPEYRTLVRN